MIELKFTAQSAGELSLQVAELARLLGPEQMVTSTAGKATKASGKVATAAVSGEAPAAAQGGSVINAVSGQDAGQTANPPASAPTPVAAPAAAGAGISAQAVLSGGSPAAAGLTFDEVKAKLKAVSDSPTGGIKKVIEILGNHGLTGANAQIKNLQPQHFATAAAQADAALAGL